jgi:mono/diheme cytochrome c family protein
MNLPLPTRIARDLAISLISLSALGLQACSGPANANPEARSSAAFKPVPNVAAASAIDAGRYLVKIGGCNDCHTPGYVETNGAQPAETDWLTGSPVGYEGPWGVSYPANLRISFANMDEQQFIELARAGKGRPPMPWPSLMAMSDQDLKAIYAYMRHLGKKGEAMPAALEPGQKITTPVVHIMPVAPPAPAKKK